MKYQRATFIMVALTVVLLLGWSVIRVSRAPRVAAPATTPVAEQRLSHGRFENFTVFSPRTTPRGVVLLFSAAAGWDPSMSERARQFTAQGALVIGIDDARFNAALEADAADCVYPDGDLENLSHFVQAYYRLPTYVIPILAGYADGAAIAYGTLAQAPHGTFAGAVSIGFCPKGDLRKQLCMGTGDTFSRARRPTGIEFLPSQQIADPWLVVQGPNDRACDAGTVRNFVAAVPGARIIAASDNSSAAAGAVDSLMVRNAGVRPPSLPAVLADLPIVAVAAQPSAGSTDVFAILLSGDGGWAGLDKDVAAALAANGIPVIGLDSLRYFWSQRTPAGLAADIDRMIRYYSVQLGRPRVMLVGYSQGADVLPFAVNRLSAASRTAVAVTAVMGMSEHALFEFHVSSWISDDNSGPATLPEVERITGVPVLCVYGEDETDTLCPKLDPKRTTVVKLKGGHHFDGDYAALARTLLAALRR